MGEGIKNFDLFRYTPSKFLENTVSGALMSLAVLAFGFWLSMHEWNVVFNNELKSEVIFDNLHMQDLQVDIDISVFNVPCEIVDLRFTSKKGKQHTVTRWEEDENTLRLPFGKRGTLFQQGASAEEVATKVNNGLGCRVVGTFYMHFLANHFHVTFGNPQLLTQVNRIMKKTKTDFVMDLSHKVHHVSFGASHSHAKTVQRWVILSF